MRGVVTVIQREASDDEFFVTMDTKGIGNNPAFGGVRECDELDLEGRDARGRENEFEYIEKRMLCSEHDAMCGWERAAVVNFVRVLASWKVEVRQRH